MSKESAKAFAQRLLDDRDFLAKFASLKGGGARREQAEAEGFDFTTEELQEAKADLTAEGAATRKPVPPGPIEPGNGGIQPLYGVIDTWETS